MNRFFYFFIGIIFMVFVYQQVKKNRLSEKESFFWIIGAIGILIVSILPNSIGLIANVLNIEYPPSLLFLVGIIFVLALVFRLTIYVSVLKEQSKELAQLNALLEKRISEMEYKIRE